MKLLATGGFSLFLMVVTTDSGMDNYSSSLCSNAFLWGDGSRFWAKRYWRSSFSRYCFIWMFYLALAAISAYSSRSAFNSASTILA
jgi:hypothetical protein